MSNYLPVNPLVYSQVDVARFWQDGYLLIKQVFTPEEVHLWRQQALEVLAEDKLNDLVTQDTRDRGLSIPQGDLLSKKYLREAVFDDRILGVARAILGTAPVYFGNSSIQFGSYALKSWKTGWHKDNRGGDRTNPTGLDWQGEYPLIRMGIYLQDHASHSGGLAVKSGSHQSERYNQGQPVLVDYEVGDLVVWNLRTTHAGHAVRFKLIPKFLQARLNMLALLVPGALKIKEQAERIAMFLTYGAHSEHLERYLEYLRSREDEVTFLKHSQFGEEVWQKAKEKNLEIIRVIPEYGRLNDRKEV